MNDIVHKGITLYFMPSQKYVDKRFTNAVVKEQQEETEQICCMIQSVDEPYNKQQRYTCSPLFMNTVDQTNEAPL